MYGEECLTTVSWPTWRVSFPALVKLTEAHTQQKPTHAGGVTDVMTV